MGDFGSCGFGSGGFGSSAPSGFGGVASGNGGGFGSTTTTGGFGSGGVGFGSAPSGGFGSGGGGFGSEGGGGGFGSGGDSGFKSSGGGDRPRGCFNCGEEGHRSADCTEPRKSRGACHNCGQEGHMSRDCTEPRKPRDGGGDRPRGCFNCGEEGHRSADCSQPRKPREGGQSFGGSGSFGGSSGGGGGFGSFGTSSGGGGFGSGGGGGSFGGDRPERPRGCFNCGQEGHRSADCSEPRKPREGGDGGMGGGERGSGCFNCGQEGHRSADCTEPRKSRGCFSCGQEGHNSADCTEPTRPREDGSKPASTFVPEDESEDQLYKASIEKGTMFERFFEAQVAMTRGGLGGGKEESIKPIATFAELQLTSQIEQNIAKSGYTKPTPVQQYTMPVVQAGVDMLACAQTGSGKTAAFLLPIMSTLIANNNLSDSSETPCQPRCLILAPTRELAQQIYNEARKFANHTVFTCQCVFGGTSVSFQKETLTRGATIIVGTTGRVKHFISEGIISLEKLKYLVLDEADRMLDMGFGEDVDFITSSGSIPPKNQRQTIMFSATFPPEVQSSAQRLMNENYVMVTIDAIGGANKCITQEVILINEKREKRGKLMELLGIDQNKYTVTDSAIYEKKTLVFVSKKTFADALGGILCEAGVPSTTIHGDRQQSQRNQAISDFKHGRKAVLVATAVAERGLDIKGVDHVINYDLPDDLDQYVHRIGRTGRVGNSGRATSLYFPAEDGKIAQGLMKCMEDAGQVVPDWLKQEGGAGGCDGGGGFGGGFGGAEDGW